MKRFEIKVVKKATKILTVETPDYVELKDLENWAHDESDELFETEQYQKNARAYGVFGGRGGDTEVILNCISEGDETEISDVYVAD